MAVLAVCFVSANAFAQPVHITIPMVEPFIVTTEKEYHGAGYEIANLIANEANLEHDTDIQPLSRSIISLANNKTDLSFFTPTILSSLPQEVKSNFVDLGYVEKIGIVLVAKRNKHPFLQQGRKYVISRLRGTCLPLVKRYPAAQWHDMSRMENLLNILILERTDMVCIPGAFLQYASVLSGSRPDELIVLDSFDEEVHLYATSLMPVETQTAIKQALANLVHRGQVTALFRKNVEKVIREIQNKPRPGSPRKRPVRPH